MHVVVVCVLVKATCHHGHIQGLTVVYKPVSPWLGLFSPVLYVPTAGT